MAKTELGILQKDGTIKKLSQAEFDKYLEDRIVHPDDIKNLTNASGKFIDLADVVEVIIDDMWDSEMEQFLGLTTIRKDGDANLVFNLTVEDMYQLANKVIEAEPKANKWMKTWLENNEDEVLAQMYADALENSVVVGGVELLILFLMIFVYNGSVEENKRIKLADWYLGEEND